MDVKIQLCLVTLASFIDVGLSISCYECSSDAPNSACTDPAANGVGTVDCAYGSCATSIHIEYGDRWTFNRGCQIACVNQTYSWFGDEYIYQCCDSDNCNGHDRPVGYTKCHSCDNTLDLGCVDWDYVDLGQYTYCKGRCSKETGEIDFFGVKTEFVTRGCNEYCPVDEQKGNYLGLGQYTSYCCDGDLCNGAAVTSAGLGLALAAGILALWL